jgi:hypothetical protein
VPVIGRTDISETRGTDFDAGPSSADTAAFENTVGDSPFQRRGQLGIPAGHTQAPGGHSSQQSYMPSEAGPSRATYPAGGPASQAPALSPTGSVSSFRAPTGSDSEVFSANINPALRDRTIPFRQESVAPGRWEEINFHIGDSIESKTPSDNEPKIANESSQIEREYKIITEAAAATLKGRGVPRKLADTVAPILSHVRARSFSKTGVANYHVGENLAAKTRRDAQGPTASSRDEQNRVWEDGRIRNDAVKRRQAELEALNPDQESDSE